MVLSDTRSAGARDQTTDIGVEDGGLGVSEELVVSGGAVEPVVARLVSADGMEEYVFSLARDVRLEWALRLVTTYVSLGIENIFSPRRSALPSRSQE
ncbi:hypothetical protein DA075_27295 [Methylobacterium currus]|uniref:Uncharacterized protein n=1 Tax=Methylobacterium currus TaxID=2051553 RepID=A0A2R4WRG8_9HYPH|nr:hypothetical protein DA075_27295 [Methylobacterium currus]